VSHYSENEGSVRMSLFKKSGKWYQDLAVDMGGFFNEPLIRNAVLKALHKQFPDRFFGPDWIVVCLEPYHVHSHPQLIYLGRAE
jgi:hypothetical protein